jgi:uncharacterized membrane protein
VIIQRSSQWAFPPLALSNKAAYFLLALFVVAGLAMRFYLAGTQPFWLDETFTWGELHHSYLDIISWRHHETHPPIAYLLAKFMYEISHHNELLIRSPFVLLSGVNIFLAYRLGSAINGNVGGLFAAMLLSFSPFLIQLDFQARMYSPWVSSMFLIVVAYRRLYFGAERSTIWRPIPFLWLGLALSLAFWVHFMSLYLWAAVGIALSWEFFLLFRQKGWSRELANAAQCGLLLVLIVGILCSPGVIKLLAIQEATKPIDFSIQRLLKIWSTFLRGAWMPMALGAVVTGLALFPVGERVLRNFLLLSLLTGSIFLVLSQNRHFIDPRYLAPLAVPVVLGLAALVSRINLFLLQRWRWPGYVMAVLVIVVGAQQLTLALKMIELRHLSSYAGNNYAPHFATALHNKIGPDDTVIFLPTYFRQVALFQGWPADMLLEEYDPRVLRENFDSPRSALWIISIRGLNGKRDTAELRKYFGNRLRCSIDKQLPVEFVSNLHALNSIALRLYGRSVTAYSLMDNRDLIQTQCMLKGYTGF